MYTFNKTSEFVDGKNREDLEILVRTVPSQARTMHKTAAE